MLEISCLINRIDRSVKRKRKKIFCAAHTASLSKQRGLTIKTSFIQTNALNFGIKVSLDVDISISFSLLLEKLKLPLFVSSFEVCVR